ncbi:uncharacterized protein LOC131216882 isoform X2 [Magnolia sinica]|uniref:uncharacterized protein LOC131216882 isoform X2 n=1 Tax=Magnolia sinica TaxID=86752 RepID=UPI002658712E|nr:uncharacterized protein LOC131216882 isoform X2 [Magnolia sinica]
MNLITLASLSQIHFAEHINAFESSLSFQIQNRDDGLAELAMMLSVKTLNGFLPPTVEIKENGPLLFIISVERWWVLVVPSIHRSSNRSGQEPACSSLC